jgi:hypothetical protein
VEASRVPERPFSRLADVFLQSSGIPAPEAVNGIRQEPVEGVSMAYTFDVGSDTGTGMDDRDHQVPFAFTGTIGKLKIASDRP